MGNCTVKIRKRTDLDEYIVNFGTKNKMPTNLAVVLIMGIVN
jgi:hypothetical protein